MPLQPGLVQRLPVCLKPTWHSTQSPLNATAQHVSSSGRGSAAGGSNASACCLLGSPPGTSPGLMVQNSMSEVKTCSCDAARSMLQQAWTACTASPAKQDPQPSTCHSHPHRVHLKVAHVLALALLAALSKAVAVQLSQLAARHTCRTRVVSVRQKTSQSTAAAYSSCPTTAQCCYAGCKAHLQDKPLAVSPGSVGRNAVPRDNTCAVTPQQPPCPDRDLPAPLP
jgi:hypothetical protein